MSADELRRAASLLRERAEKAKRVEGMVDVPLGAMTAADYRHVILPAEVDYITTFTPDLGLAFADWLEDTAGRRYHTPTPPDHALTVARLILGGAQ